MNEKRQNLFIGLVVASGVTLVAAFVLFIRPHVGDGRKQLRVWFVNIDKISRGTPVTLAGRSIGEVSEIHSITEAREQKVDALGRVYYYELRLRVDSHAQIYTTDAIFMQTSGLLGERNIAIIPKHIPNRQAAQLADEHSPLCAQSTNSVEEAVAEISQTVVQAQTAVRELGQLIRDNQSNATQALQGIAKATGSIDQFISQLNERDFATQLTQFLQSARKFADQSKILMRELSSDEVVESIQGILQHASRVLAALDDPTRWKNILKGAETLLDSSREALAKLSGHDAEIDAILRGAQLGVVQFQQIGTQGIAIAKTWSELTNDVKLGKGTLGKILYSGSLYTQADALLDKSNTLVGDISQYGLLFQNNRDWKRARAQRIASVEKLKDPGAFQAYCDQELSALQTECTRIESLWQAAQQQPSLQTRSAFLKGLTQLVSHLTTLQQNLDAMKGETVSK